MDNEEIKIYIIGGLAIIASVLIPAMWMMYGFKL